MIRSRRNKKYLYVLILFLALGIGFAALAANLKINGTVNIDSASWDVHFENVQITQGSVTANPAPTSNNVDTTEMTYTVNFTKPGDFYEFTVDIANDGSIDAMINLVSNTTYEQDGTTPKNLPDYLRSSVTYDDGVQIKQNQELLHNTSETIKVRIEYRTDIDTSDLPDTADTVVFKFSGDYKQKDDTAIPVRVDFSTASWNDITTAYTSNPSSLLPSMKAGTTKEVQLDLDNDDTAETTVHLRIANLSTPIECSTQGYSQSACGLVIEFAEAITPHRMNQYTDASVEGDGNKGGWEYSDMRAYLNSTTYAYENIDYSASGIFNSLPSDLRNKIINTTVVSGHGSRDSANFTTTDKLYLLSAKELWGSDMEGFDLAANLTRQLDYYHEKGVSPDNYSEAIKQNIVDRFSTDWWLRSAASTTKNRFLSVYINGSFSYKGSSNDYGISPAFRIA